MADSFVPMSQWLLGKARELDVPEPGEDPGDLRETRELIGELIQWTKAGRLATLTGAEQEHWARHLVDSGGVSDLLDEALAIDALTRVPSQVRRMLRLSSLWTAVPLPPDVAELLNETVLAYIYGLPGAATSLARATLERALKNATGQPNLGLSALIEAARRGAFLEEIGGVAATKVKTAADRVLHQGGPNHDEAFEVILSLREALSQLLGGELGPQSRP